MNTPVSFPIAKLIKEKGFDLRLKNGYTSEGNYTSFGREQYYNVFRDVEYSNINLPYTTSVTFPNPILTYVCTAPTIVEVVMWLYEKHGIWITVWSAYNNSYKFSYGILHRKNIVVFHETNFDEKDSPTEAYEAAIDYTLKNLIYENNK
jgi:hypothetical protein